VLAGLAGVPQRQLSRIESGQRAPGITVLTGVTRALGMALEDLFMAQEQAVPPTGEAPSAVNEGSDSDVDDDVVARAILLGHHLLPRPTTAQLAVALELVALDPEGSRALAFGTPPPPGREDVLTAPALGVYLPPLKPASPTPEGIRDLVAAEYNVKVPELISLTLRPDLVWPRAAAIYVAVKHTGAGPETIAAAFGRRRPETVRQSCKSVLDRISSDVAARNAIARLEASVLAGGRTLRRHT
jgi:transcriptional regulator with XRE-family HTH domain